MLKISAVKSTYACCLSLSYCLFSSYHFHLADGFGWFSIVFVTAVQKVPSEPTAPGSLGVFDKKESCGRVHSITKGLRWEGAAGDCLVQPLCSPRGGHPIRFWVSPRRDSTASLGNPCQGSSFTSGIIESILKQLLNLFKLDKQDM